MKIKNGINIYFVFCMSPYTFIPALSIWPIPFSALIVAQQLLEFILSFPYVIFSKMCSILTLQCLQGMKISCLELRVASFGLNKMKYFSSKHSLHFPETGLKLLALPNIFHSSLYPMFLCLRDQTYLLSIVMHCVWSQSYVDRTFPWMFQLLTLCMILLSKCHSLLPCMNTQHFF